MVQVHLDGEIIAVTKVKTRRDVTGGLRRVRPEKEPKTIVEGFNRRVEVQQW